MASFAKFNSFVEALAEGSHNLGSDQITVALTNTAPVATNTQLSDITEISYTNLSSRNVTTASSSQTSGTYKLTLTDLVLTSSGGSTGPFRYVILFNNTSASDLLIGYYDRGSSVTVGDGETFTIDFDGTNGAITLT